MNLAELRQEDSFQSWKIPLDMPIEDASARTPGPVRPNLRTEAGQERRSTKASGVFRDLEQMDL
jgi:hypothetical protein